MGASGKNGCVREEWVRPGRMSASGKDGCIWEGWVCLGRMGASGKKGCVWEEWVVWEGWVRLGRMGASGKNGLSGKDGCVCDLGRMGASEVKKAFERNDRMNGGAKRRDTRYNE